MVHDDRGCSAISLIVIFILTFLLQVVGYLTPFWQCNTSSSSSSSSCAMLGLFYSCDDSSSECTSGVVDSRILGLTTATIISNLVIFIISIILCKQGQVLRQTLSVHIGLGLGMWYIFNETLSFIAIIILHANYSNVGWSAYVFCAPVAFIIVVLGIILCAFCYPAVKIDIEPQPAANAYVT